MENSYVSATRVPRNVAANPMLPHDAGCRVLVIDFRDEVFAAISNILRGFDCQVHRAESSETVSKVAGRVPLDLILLNQQMPTESGWLISCKLRLTCCWQPIWMYTADRNAHRQAWQHLARVDAIFEYDGDVWRLSNLIEDRLANERRELVADVRPRTVLRRTISAV